MDGLWFEISQTSVSMTIVEAKTGGQKGGRGIRKKVEQFQGQFSVPSNPKAGTIGQRIGYATFTAKCPSKDLRFPLKVTLSCFVQEIYKYSHFSSRDYPYAQPSHTLKTAPTANPVAFNCCCRFVIEGLNVPTYVNRGGRYMG